MRPDVRIHVCLSTYILYCTIAACWFLCSFAIYPSSASLSFFFSKHIMSSSLQQEQVLVSGNSKRAPLEIADQLPSKLSTPNLTVTWRHMLLDDFLEQAKWTRLVIIVTSSYGAGQAPIGGC